MLSFFGGRRYGRQLCYVSYRPLSRNQIQSQQRQAAHELGPSTSGYQGDSEGFDKDGPSAKKAKKRRETETIARKSDLSEKWSDLDEDYETEALIFMKNCIMSPFLFNSKYNYSSKVISWLQKGDMLPKYLSCRNVSLSDESLNIVALVEVVIDEVFFVINSESFLQEMSLFATDVQKCKSFEEVMALTRIEWRKLVMQIRKNISVDSSTSEEKIHLSIVIVVCQVVKHAKQTVGIMSRYQNNVQNHWKRKEKEVEKLKSQGNKLFNHTKYLAAIDAYSHALSLSPFNHILYGNRAQCNLKICKFREALSDARRAVFLEPTWEKGQYRFAEAYCGLGLLDTAVTVNTRARELCGETLCLMDQADKFRQEQNRPTPTSPTLASHDNDIPDLCNSSSSADESCSCSDCECEDDEDEDSYFTCDSMPELLSSEDELNSPWKTKQESNNQDSQNGARCSLSSSSSSQPFPEGSLDLDDINSIPSLESDDSHESLLDIEKDLSDGILGDEVSEDAPELVSDSESDLDYTDNSDGEVLGSPFDEPGEISGNGLFVSSAFSPGMEILRQLSLATFNNFDAAIEAFQRLEAALHESEGESAPPPTLPAVIESLPSIQISQEHIDSNTTCPICHCEYELKEDALLLPCEHFYHPPCITTWLKMHATCPTCRHVLPY